MTVTIISWGINLCTEHILLTCLHMVRDMNAQDYEDVPLPPVILCT